MLAAVTGFMGGRCTWRGEVAGTEGATVHDATFIALTNIGPEACLAPNVRGVHGIGVDGHRVDATAGSYFPIGPPPSPIGPGNRVLLILATSHRCSGDPVPAPVESVVIRLGDQSSTTVALRSMIDTACGFGFSALGSA